MTRRGNNQTRASRRQQDTAAKLLVAGIALAVAPLFFTRDTILGKALASLTWPGLLLAAVGGLLLWLSRRSGPPQATPAPSAAGGGAVPDEVAEIAAIAPTAPCPETWSPAVFAAIEWRRFEAVVEALFGQAGFETRSQSHGADEGVDIWLYSRHQPGEPVSLVQCKHWQSNRVGVDKIRELRGVMASRNVKRGQFATTSTFTPEAIAFAGGNGIHLLDVNGLLDLIGKRTPREQADLLAVALEGEYWKPTCVNCGVKMAMRANGKTGALFWGCGNFPRCKKTMQMRLA